MSWNLEKKEGVNFYPITVILVMILVCIKK